MRYERARHIFLAVGRDNAALDDEALCGLLRRSKESLRAYVSLLAGIARAASVEPRPALAAMQAFTVAEQLRSGAAQAALAKAGARTAAADPATANLARHVQELRTRRQAMGKRLSEAYGQPGTHRHASPVVALQQAVQQLDHDLREATERLYTAFPQYAELATPVPIEVAAVQGLLAPDEALVSFFTLPDRLLVWLVQRDQPPGYRDVEITRATLTTMVNQVRQSLDPRLRPDGAPEQLRPFEVAASQALYTLLLAPWEAQLAGVTHLLLVPDDVLLPLPFGVLVTQTVGDAYQSLAERSTQELAPSPRELTEYPRLAWLIKHYALTVLPSATSLRNEN